MSRLRRNNSNTENTNTTTKYTPKVFNFYNTPEAKPNKPIHISKVRYDNRPRSYEKKSNKPATYYQEEPKTRTLYASEEDEEIVDKQSNEEDEFFMNNELYGYHVEQMVTEKTEKDWNGKYTKKEGYSKCMKGNLFCKSYGKMAHFSSSKLQDNPMGSLNKITDESKNIMHITEGKDDKLTLYVLCNTKRKDDVYMVRTREVTTEELNDFNNSQGLINSYGDGLQFGDASSEGDGRDYKGFEQLISSTNKGDVKGAINTIEVEGVKEGVKDEMFFHSFEIKIMDDSQPELNEVLVAEILNCKKDKKGKYMQKPYKPDQVVDRVYIVIKDDDRPKFDHKEGEPLIIVKEGDEAVIKISGKNEVEGLFLKARSLNEEEKNAYCGKKGMYEAAKFKRKEDELDVKNPASEDGRVANCNQKLEFKKNEATVKIQTYNDDKAGKDKLFALDIVDNKGIKFSKPMLVCIDDSDDRPSFDKKIYWIKEEDKKLEIKVSASETASVRFDEWEFSTADATEDDIKTLNYTWHSFDDLLFSYDAEGRTMPKGYDTKEIEKNLGVDNKTLMEYRDLYYEIKKNIRNEIRKNKRLMEDSDTKDEERKKAENDLNQLEADLEAIDSWRGFGAATGGDDYVKVEPRELPPDFGKREPPEKNKCTFTVEIKDDEAVEKEECFIIQLEHKADKASMGITSKVYVVISDFHDRLENLRNHPFNRRLDKEKMDDDSSKLLAQLNKPKADTTTKGGKKDAKEMDYKSAMLTLYRENKKLKAKLKKRRK